MFYTKKMENFKIISSLICIQLAHRIFYNQPLVFPKVILHISPSLRDAEKLIICSNDHFSCFHQIFTNLWWKRTFLRKWLAWFSCSAGNRNRLFWNEHAHNITTHGALGGQQHFITVWCPFIFDSNFGDEILSDIL